MSTRRSQATLLNDIKLALKQVKKETSTDQPKVYSLNTVRNQYSLPGVFAEALAQSKYIELSRSAKGAAGRAHVVRWVSDINLDDSGTIDKFHRLLSNLESKRKSVYGKHKSDKKPVRKVDVEVTPKSLPTVNQKRGSYKKRAEKIVGSADVTKTSQIRQVIKGAIFGLKQLQWLRMTVRQKPTTVILDDYVTIDNIKGITYHVDGTKLTMKFYAYADHQGVDETTKISEISVNNRVIAMYEHGGDTQMEILRITTVQVTDPFNLNL